MGRVTDRFTTAVIAGTIALASATLSAPASAATTAAKPASPASTTSSSTSSSSSTASTSSSTTSSSTAPAASTSSTRATAPSSYGSSGPSFGSSGSGSTRSGGGATPYPSRDTTSQTRYTPSVGSPSLSGAAASSSRAAYGQRDAVPRTGEMQSVSPTAVRAKPPGSGYTVRVVDDDAECRNMLSHHWMNLYNTMCVHLSTEARTMKGGGPYNGMGRGTSSTGTSGSSDARTGQQSGAPSQSINTSTQQKPPTHQP